MPEKPDDKTTPNPNDGGKPDDGADDGADESNLAGLKSALAKERLARRAAERTASENAGAAEKLKGIEDEKKSAEVRAAEKVAEADKRVAEADARVMRWEVAISKNMPVALARRLVGTTREELEADADDLLATVGGTPEGGNGGEPGKGKPATTPTPGGLKARPTEKLQPGAAPAAEPVEMDPKKLADKVPPMY
jgi:hypothetical protein